jgi:hypothetical protein
MTASPGSCKQGHTNRCARLGNKPRWSRTSCGVAPHHERRGTAMSAGPDLDRGDKSAYTRIRAAGSSDQSRRPRSGSATHQSGYKCCRRFPTRPNRDDRHAKPESRSRGQCSAVWTPMAMPLPSKIPRGARSPALWEWRLDKLSNQRCIALEHRPLLFRLSDRSHK